MRAWLRRVQELATQVALAIVLVLLLVFGFFTQTSFGRERVLEELLARAETAIRGDIEVGGISSLGLLRGVTFREVTIRGEDGRTFLWADSVRAGISGPALLRGDLVLRGVRLWSPRVTLERLPDQDRMNVVRIFTAEPPLDSLAAATDSLATAEGEERPGARRTILLQNARIHQGSLEVLLPLSPGQAASDRILTAPGPGGTPALRRMTFRDIDLELDQAILTSPGQRGERFGVRHLSFVGEVWPDAFRVSDVEGEIRREGSRLLASLRTLELTNSRALGRVDVRWGGGEGPRVTVEGEADPLALEDLFFIDRRLPAGDARGPFGLELNDEGLRLDFRGTELTTEAGRILARGGLLLGGTIGFDGLDLGLTGVDLALTDPWVTNPIPLRGRLTGDLALAGTLEELQVKSRVDLVDPDSVGVMTADVSGQMGFETGFSASSLYVTLAPLEWGALASISPAMRLRGPGAVRVVLSGSLRGSGLNIDGEATHVPSVRMADAPPSPGPGARTDLAPATGASRVTVDGWVRQDSANLFLNLNTRLSPLSLTTLGQSFPDLPLEGEYAGRVDLRGPISDLSVAADLETSAGPLSVTARLDARRVADSYSVEATAAEEFVLSNLLPSLPDPTTFIGTLNAVGRGFSLDSLQGRADATVLGGVVGPLRVDSASIEATIEGGVLILHRLVAETGAGHLDGSGSFGVASTAPSGLLNLEFRSESLAALRPFLMEEPETIFENLSPYQRDLLVMEGADLDTLTRAAEVAVDGSVQGYAVFRGGIDGFEGEGTLDFQNLRFRTDYVESGGVTFQTEKRRGEEGRIRAQLRTDSLNVLSLGFRAGRAEVDLGKSSGRLRLTVEGYPDDEAVAYGTYVLDSLGGGIVNLDELTLRLDSVRWNLGGPASFAWNADGYRVRDFQLIRPGADLMRVRANGFLPLEEGGEGDFLLEAEELNLLRLARAIQMETPLEGTVDFRGRITGSASRPRINGTLSGRGLRYAEFSLGELRSSLRYDGQQIDLDLSADDGGRQVLFARGFFPADLRFRSAGPRIPHGPVDLTVSADSFPAAVALAFLQDMEDVEGALSGNLRFGGSSTDLEPSGDFYLFDGAASIPALGVRHRAVGAHLVLTPDGVVRVDGSLRSGGTARVSGTVTLVDPLANPRLDLTLEGQNFLAVSRRDVQARISGSVMVTESYRRPRVEGALTVEEGVLMVDEIARSVEVVDLSDPAFFDVVDTTLVTLQPILRASQNPFLQNLRLSVDLTMVQDSWLRGRELNVEMAGSLGVYWDRTERNLAFLGVLDAVRGVYSVFGRQFQVEEGTVSFPGTPGINPDLDITALSRLRTTDGPLDITATVKGSLLAPRVTLSSNAPFPIAESDLVSYLIFGQPSYALGSGQRRVAAEARDLFTGAGASLAVGLFSSELGSLIAKDVGLDYLAITQGQDQRGGQTIPGLGTTQVEIGQYLTDNIFAALYWRPLGSGGGTDQNRLAALRIETRLSDRWTLEGYMEDPLFRTSLFRVGGPRPNEWNLGFFLYRVWGY